MTSELTINNTCAPSAPMTITPKLTGINSQLHTADDGSSVTTLLDSSIRTVDAQTVAAAGGNVCIVVYISKTFKRLYSPSNNYFLSLQAYYFRSHP